MALPPAGTRPVAQGQTLPTQTKLTAEQKQQLERTLSPTEMTKFLSLQLGQSQVQLFLKLEWFPAKDLMSKDVQEIRAKLSAGLASADSEADLPDANSEPNFSSVSSGPIHITLTRDSGSEDSE